MKISWFFVLSFLVFLGFLNITLILKKRKGDFRFEWQKNACHLMKYILLLVFVLLVVMIGGCLGVCVTNARLSAPNADYFKSDEIINEIEKRNAEEKVCVINSITRAFQRGRICFYIVLNEKIDDMLVAEFFHGIIWNYLNDKEQEIFLSVRVNGENEEKCYLITNSSIKFLNSRNRRF